MAERIRREKRESAATGAVHGGGDPMQLAKSSSSHAAPDNNAASFSCGVGRGAVSLKLDPPGPTFHYILPNLGKGHA